MQPRTGTVRPVWLSVGLAIVLVAGCFAPGNELNADETGGTETPIDSESMSSTTADGGTVAGVDGTIGGTADGTTGDADTTGSSGPTGSTTAGSNTTGSVESGSDTGGCEPAVFGLSTLNDACFQ